MMMYHFMMSMMIMMLTSTLLVIPFLNSLIALGGILMSMAIIMTLLLTKLIHPWYGLILFLIFVTGLLIMFTYMIALSPNPYMFKSFTLSILLITTLVLMSYKVEIIYYKKSDQTYDISVILMFSYSNLWTYWLMVMTLLMALILVVLMCHKSPTPLRPFL